MLINGSKLLDCPILSLHLGGRIANVTDLIIDPNDLKLIALRVDGPVIDAETGDLLPINAVREFSRLGMVIDSNDEFVHETEVIHLRDILKLHFRLNGLKVITKKKAKLGKVSDYILNTSSWQVQQLIVKRPFTKALFDPELTIHRRNIIEVTDYEVIVKEEHEKAKQKAPLRPAQDFSPNFINPFRKPDFAPDASKTSNPKND